MQITGIGTEGRGWNWGYRFTSKWGVLRVRVLTWFPFIRITLRTPCCNETCIEEVLPHTPIVNKPLPFWWRKDHGNI